MKYKFILFMTISALLGHGLALAGVDLVILPRRDTVQLTIYNSADLTLVKEKRALTLKKGLNHLQFSWANTLIDPTSLDMRPDRDGDKIDILDLTFPPRVRNLGQWSVRSRISGNVPVEITYLTSGLSWRAFYMGTLSQDEKTMSLQGYVRVTNNSGEDYEKAQVRMIVGRINLIDAIARLARQKYPYGRPGTALKKTFEAETMDKNKVMVKRQMVLAGKEMMARPKEIKKEGLSEYFLYSIEGRETVPNGWSKRLPSFNINNIPVVNFYKYEEERFGKRVMRYLSFKNDKGHKLGGTPIPGGTLKIYRNTGMAARLSYEGQSSFKYIPVGEDARLNLGAVSNVIIKAKLMDYKTGRFLFDNKGNITGWNEIREFEIKTKNTRNIPVSVEIKRNFKTSNWDLTKNGDYGTYKKENLNTVKFTQELKARETKKFRYVLTTYHGQRAD